MPYSKPFFLAAALVVSLAPVFSPAARAQSLTELRYDEGTPSVLNVYVDPVNGRDSSNGLTPTSAYKTLDAAWRAIPMNQTLGLGRRINILPGTLPESALPNYLESRHGTFAAPIIIRANNGRGTVTLGGDLNVFDTTYLYIEDLKIIPSPPGDAFHCEQCDHLLIRNSELSGGNQQAHDLLKVNQSEHVYIEDSNIHGADDNAIDFVAVQYGHVVRNLVHDAQDWCEYAKGGSAYLRIEGNQFYDCGTGGFTAGQGTGLEFMTSPWLHYEAYDIKVINNVVHDTEGAGLGVNGGYNILLAYNTLYRIGSRSHTIEVVFGARSCDGNSQICQANLDAGGWGTASTGDDADSAPIGDKNVYVYNNVIYNPSDFESGGQQFALYGPEDSLAGSNVPGPVVVDDNLQIRGNFIYNDPSEAVTGIDEDSACQPSNPTCNATQLAADNTFSSVPPNFVDPAHGDFRPAAGGNLTSALTFAIPAFGGNDRPSPPLSPAGNLDNTIDRDRAETARSGIAPPGAYASASSPINPPGGGGNIDRDRPPTISKFTCSPTKVKVKKTMKCSVTAADDRGVRSVSIKTTSLSLNLKSAGRGVYKGNLVLRKSGKYTLVATAIDSGNQRVSTRGLKVTVTK